MVWNEYDYHSFVPIIRNLTPHLNSRLKMYGFTPLPNYLIRSYPTEPTDKAKNEIIAEVQGVGYRPNQHTSGAFQPLTASNPPFPPSYFEGKWREGILYTISKPLVNLMFDGKSRDRICLKLVLN